MQAGEHLLWTFVAFVCVSLMGYRIEWQFYVCVLFTWTMCWWRVPLCERAQLTCRCNGTDLAIHTTSLYSIFLCNSWHWDYVARGASGNYGIMLRAFFIFKLILINKTWSDVLGGVVYENICKIFLQNYTEILSRRILEQINVSRSKSFLYKPERKFYIFSMVK